MSKNFYLAVYQDTGNETTDLCAEVVVKTMLEATGLVASNMSKQRRIEMHRTTSPASHRTSAAAQAYIDVELFQLVPNE